MKQSSYAQMLFEEGLREGREVGLREGREKWLRERAPIMILEIVRRRLGITDPQLESALASIKDLVKLGHILVESSVVQNLDDLLKLISGNQEVADGA